MKTLRKPAAALLLLGATVVWGSAFTVIKIVIGYGLPVGFMNILRGFGLAFMIFAVFSTKIIKMSKKEAVIGLIAGVTNSLGYLFQSIGLKYTTPTAGAFLTIMHTVFVPIIALVIYRVRPGFKLIPSIILAIAGTFLLTSMSFTNFSIGKGELLCIACALSFAFSIAVLSNTGEGVSSEPVVFWMGITQGVAGIVYFFAFEGGATGGVNWAAAALPLIYLVVMCSFGTTTSQVISQRSLDASTAAIIMTMEAVFGTLISLLAGYDTFGWRLLAGGALIFSGVIIILLPPFPRHKRRFSPSKNGNPK